MIIIAAFLDTSVFNTFTNIHVYLTNVFFASNSFNGVFIYKKCK